MSSPPSTRYDLCLVYSDEDGDQWWHYVVHYLGRDQFRFRLLPVTDRLLVDWLRTSRSAGATAPSLREAAEARAFVVVVTPALVRAMADQPLLDFRQLVDEPRTAQVTNVFR